MSNHRLTWTRSIASVFAVVAISTSNVWSAEKVVTVDAGKYVRSSTPVSIEIPDEWKDHKQFRLIRVDDRKEVSSQVLKVTKNRLTWILQKPIEAKKTRLYRLRPIDSAPTNHDGVTVSDDGKRIRVAVGKKSVLVYNTAVVKAADRKQSYYDRSGHIHPLFNPSGQAVTDDFASDHPHQHGIMFPWTDTTYEGRDINFWDQQKRRATVKHESIKSITSGAVFGEFVATLSHLDITMPDKPKAALTETWRVRVYNVAEGFLFDFESTQRAVSSPLQINQYHYGAMAIRGHRNWLTAGQGDFLTSEGKTRKDGNHSRPRWVDIHGLIDGKTTGVTIFCDPRNFRFPQPVRLHPSKPYFCFAPMVLGGFKITADKPYVSRYRFFVHDGKLDTKVAERICNDLAEPVKVTVQ